MAEQTKYKSMEDLKATSKPMDPNSTRSQESHVRQESFINFLKEGTIKYTSPSRNRSSVRKDVTNES